MTMPARSLRRSLGFALFGFVLAPLLIPFSFRAGSRLEAAFHTKVERQLRLQFPGVSLQLRGGTPLDFDFRKVSADNVNRREARVLSITEAKDNGKAEDRNRWDALHGVGRAVLIDDTILRVVIGPALLEIAGDWNWWPLGLHGSKVTSIAEVAP